MAAIQLFQNVGMGFREPEGKPDFRRFVILEDLPVPPGMILKCDDVVL